MEKISTPNAVFQQGNLELGASSCRPVMWNYGAWRKKNVIHAVASRTSAHLYAFLVSRTEFERAHMVFAVTNALRKTCDQKLG